MCSKRSVFRKLAESELIYSRDSEMPPGKSETRRITGVRQRTGKFGSHREQCWQKSCRKDKNPVFLEYKVQEGRIQRTLERVRVNREDTGKW